MSRQLMPALLLLATFLGTQASGQVSEGNKPFVPTRLEWLELYLNAGRGVTYSPQYGYGINYAADSSKDTIVIVLIYHPDHVNKKAMETAVLSARAIIAAYANKRDWTWLKVRVEEKSLVARPVASKDPKTDKPADESGTKPVPKPPKVDSPPESP